MAWLLPRRSNGALVVTPALFWRKDSAVA